MACLRLTLRGLIAALFVVLIVVAGTLAVAPRLPQPALLSVLWKPSDAPPQLLLYDVQRRLSLPLATLHPLAARDPALWSSDGALFASYAADPDTLETALIVRDMANRVRAALPMIRAQDPAFAPDGTSLTYRVFNLPGDRSTLHRVTLADPDKSLPLLPDPVWQRCWLDADRLLLDDGAGRIWIADAASGETLHIVFEGRYIGPNGVPGPLSLLPNGASCAPGGGQILLAGSLDPQTFHDLLLIDLTTGAETLYTDRIGAAWSPDGRWLLLETRPLPSPPVLIDRVTGTERRLRYAAAQAEWSPDGRWLLLRDSQGVWGLLPVDDLDAPLRRPLADLDGQIHHVTWRP